MTYKRRIIQKLDKDFEKNGRFYIENIKSLFKKEPKEGQIVSSSEPSIEYIEHKGIKYILCNDVVEGYFPTEKCHADTIDLTWMDDYRKKFNLRLNVNNPFIKEIKVNIDNLNGSQFSNTTSTNPRYRQCFGPNEECYPFDKFKLIIYRGKKGKEDSTIIQYIINFIKQNKELLKGGIQLEGFDLKIKKLLKYHIEKENVSYVEESGNKSKTNDEIENYLYHTEELIEMAIQEFMTSELSNIERVTLFDKRVRQIRKRFEICAAETAGFTESDRYKQVCEYLTKNIPLGNNNNNIKGNNVNEIFDNIATEYEIFFGQSDNNKRL